VGLLSKEKISKEKSKEKKINGEAYDVNKQMIRSQKYASVKESVLFSLCYACDSIVWVTQKESGL